MKIIILKTHSNVPNTIHSRRDITNARWRTISPAQRSKQRTISPARESLPMSRQRASKTKNYIPYQHTISPYEKQRTRVCLSMPYHITKLPYHCKSPPLPKKAKREKVNAHNPKSARVQYHYFQRAEGSHQ